MRRLDELTKREKQLRDRAVTFGILLLIGASIGGVTYYSLIEDAKLEFSSEDSSLDDLKDLIKKKMEADSFYSEKSSKFSTSSDTYDYAYMRLIDSYLERFYSYMSDEQIALLIDYIENQFPYYDYQEIDADQGFQHFLDSLYESDKKGYGMYKALTIETSGHTADKYYQDRHHGGCYHFSVLANLVGYENLISAIYEEDSRKIIDVICRETSIEREKAERLIQVFDNYYENYDYNNGMKEDFIDEMNVLIASIIQSKYDTDPVFRDGFFASALMNSHYFKEDGEEFVVNYWEDSFCFRTNFSFGGMSWVNLPYYYLNSNMDLDTVIDSSAWCVIDAGYAEDLWYQTKAVELLSYIVPWSQVQYMADSNFTTYQKKQMFYECLEDYFESEREFNEFVINLDMERSEAIDRFFSIWKSQMMSGPVTIQKLLDLNTLHSRITSHTYLDFRDINPDSLERGSEGADTYIDRLRDFYFVTDYDYMKQFDEVRSYFYQQDSTFTELLSTESLPVYYADRSWVDGTRKLSDTLIFPVLSRPLTLERRELDEEHFIYCFVKPENYPEGDFVRVFDNIENRRTEVLVPGVSTTFKNEETGKEEEVLIVSFDEECSIDNVYYKVDYFELYPKEYDQIIINPGLYK